MSRSTPSTWSALLVPLAAGLAIGAPTGVEAPGPEPDARSQATEDTGGHTAEAREVVVEAGTEIRLTLEDRLSTGSSDAGDRFRARVADPVVVGAVVALPAGAHVRGRVASVRDPDESDRAGIELAVETVVVDDRAYDLSATVVDAQPEKSGDPNRGEKGKKIGGGAAAGALLGAIVGDDVKGAVIGAAAGAATGSIIYAGTRGEKLTLPAGSEIRVETDRRLTVERDI